MDSYCISPKRGKGLRSSHWLLPSALCSQLLLPMWLGTCTMEKVRGGDIGLLSEPNSSSSLPLKGLGDGRVPDVVCLHCRRFVHTQWVGGALTPSWQQGTEERAATCTGLCVPVPQTQHAMVYGAIVVRVASSVSMRRIHGALSALLLLLLLHQQLLQGRGAGVHHGTGPDGLKTNSQH